MARKSRGYGTSDFREFGNLVLVLSCGCSALGFGSYEPGKVKSREGEKRKDDRSALGDRNLAEHTFGCVTSKRQNNSKPAEPAKWTTANPRQFSLVLECA